MVSGKRIESLSNRWHFINAFSMNRQTLLSSAAFSAIFFAATLPSNAQRANMSAREAIGLVSTQFGPNSIQWIAEMRAQGGIPQPSDWQILTYDERAPRLLYRFWAGGGRAGDGGLDELRYPDDVPIGYFNVNQIGVDSVAAFTIAEGEARRAQMAFDSCDYLLRVREYSSEPVWRLELLDSARNLAGKLYISAATGEVLRTVWVYRDRRARPDGLPLIVDSFAPTRGSATPSLTGTGNPTLDPVPAQGGIAGMAPQQSQPQPYAPVSPSGRPVDDGIPAPPPMSNTPIAPVVPVAPVAPVAPAPVAPPISSNTGIRDMRDDPPAAAAPKPPITPSTSSGGNSERIPPPPIPR